MNENVNLSDADRLHGLIADYERALDAGLQPDRQALVRACPESQRVALADYFDDSDLRRLVPTGPHLPQGSTTPEAPPAEPQPLPVVQGHEIVGELGRGGMGVVYKARHQGLGRLVALKMIKGRRGLGEPERERFNTEARAVARLYHPNIVPLHEAGEHDGQPFFTLEYVAGGTLAGRLKKEPLSPAAAAALMETLAAAVHYAHSCGVLHRDLKPANVLLTETGAPQVADFGLAHLVDEQGALEGVVMGTPPYMAPEQARGEKLDERTDVYGLGATLYECLTGRPPFEGRTVTEVLEQVKTAEVASPRCGNPGLSRDLEAICLKCLEKDPGRRYGKAAELQDDLRRFREGEPVQARRVSLGERLLKWAKRRPTAAALLGVTLGSLVGAVVLVLLLNTALDEARRQESRAIEKAAEAEREGAEAERQRRREEASHKQALALVQRLERLVKELPKVAGAEQIRTSLLKEIRDHYEQFIARKDNNPALRRHLAGILLDGSLVLHNLDTNEQALFMATRGRELCEELLREDPTDRTIKNRLGIVLNNIGQYLVNSGQAAQAVPTLERSIQLRKELFTNTPVNTLDGRKLRSDLAGAILNLGNICRELGRRGECLGHYREALALQDEMYLVHKESNPRFFPTYLATIHNLVVALGEEGETEEAAALLVRGKGILQRFPELREMSDSGPEAANLDIARGHTLSQPKELERACACYYRAHTTLASLIERDDPQGKVLRKRLGRVKMHLGQAYRDAGHFKEAERWLTAAVAWQEQLRREDDQNLDLLVNLWEAYAAQGNLCNRMKAAASAFLTFQKQVSVCRDLVRLDPNNPLQRVHLAVACSNCAGAAIDLQNKDREATKWNDEARDILEPLVRDHPEQLQWKRQLAICVFHAAMSLQGANVLHERLALYDRAIVLFREVLVGERTGGAHSVREELATAYSNQSYLLVQKGKPAEVEEAVTALEKLAPRNGRLYWVSAKALALCVPLIDDAVPGAKEERNRLSRRALQLLELAVQHGFKGMKDFEEAKELDRVKNLPGWEVLRQKLEK